MNIKIAAALLHISDEHMLYLLQKRTFSCQQVGNTIHLNTSELQQYKQLQDKREALLHSQTSCNVA
jgi:hypothetical protein